MRTVVRWFVVVVVVGHGLIHLLGAAKGLGWAEVAALPEPISRALGAAWLAGLAIGFWASREEIAAQWQVERRFEPLMPEGRRLELMATWARAVERSRGWSAPSPES